LNNRSIKLRDTDPTCFIPHLYDFVSAECSPMRLAGGQELPDPVRVVSTIRE
jgi:hypothetical protein